MVLVQMTTIAIFWLALVLTRRSRLRDHTTVDFLSLIHHQLDVLKIEISISVLIEASQEGAVRQWIKLGMPHIPWGITERKQIVGRRLKA